MSKKLFKERQFNLGIVESYKKSSGQDSAILGSFDVKGMTVEGMVSQNKTQYSEAVWRQPTAFGKGGKFLDESGKLKPSTLFGSVDHPIDNRAELLLQEAAIAWHDVRRNEDGSWDGSAHILNNPQGRIVKTFLDYSKEVGGGDLLGVSSRALGESQLVEQNGEQVEAIVPESFELMSFDFVYNPSFQTATARLNESKGSKKNVLVESVRKLAYQDIGHADLYKDFADKLETIEKEYKEGNKDMKFEGNSLKNVRTKYLKELRQEEKKLHDALHELKMMSDEEFAEKNSGDRGKLLSVVKEEYDEVRTELERLEQEQEGTMVEDTMEEEVNMKEANMEGKMHKEAKCQEVMEAYMEAKEFESACSMAEGKEDKKGMGGLHDLADSLLERAGMSHDEAKELHETMYEMLEAKHQEMYGGLTTESTEESSEDVVEETNETEESTEKVEEGVEVMEEDEEPTEEEMEELEDAAEEMAEELEDAADEAGEEDEEMEVELEDEPTIESLSEEIMSLKEILQELRDFLMPVEDAELELDDEAEEDEEELEELVDDMDEDGEEADDLDLDEEDLDELSDEELEYLANLDL